jgi:hypothetical protein
MGTEENTGQQSLEVTPRSKRKLRKSNFDGDLFEFIGKAILIFTLAIVWWLCPSEQKHIEKIEKYVLKQVEPMSIDDFKSRCSDSSRWEFPLQTSIPGHQDGVKTTIHLSSKEIHLCRVMYSSYHVIPFDKLALASYTDADADRDSRITSVGFLGFVFLRH